MAITALAVMAFLVDTYVSNETPHVKRAEFVVKIRSTSRYGKILVTRGGFQIAHQQRGPSLPALRQAGKENGDAALPDPPRIRHPVDACEKGQPKKRFSRRIRG